MKSSLSRLHDIRATAAPPCRLRGEVPTNCQPDDLYAAIRETVHGERSRAKVIADGLGCPVQRITDLADPLRRVSLKAHQIPAFVSASGSFAILDWLEAQVGRVAFTLPVVVNPSHADLVFHAAATMRECAEALSTLSGHLADGTLTEAERVDVERKIAATHVTLAAMSVVMKRAVAA